MFESEEDRQHFLVKYNISQDRFRESGKHLERLLMILKFIGMNT